ncbi:MAG: zinc ribbon domain-containing protein, partial [Phycisphaeraceae bacterium]
MALFGLLTVGLGMVGLALLLWGGRGRRVGDHPHCRACGFDLFGLAEDTTGCPECGHDLTRPRASVRGARQRRKGALAVGGMLVIVTSALVGLSTWHRTSKAAFYAKAPSIYLVWALPDPLARDELSNRLNNGNLSAGMTKRVVDRALDVQGDPARTWDDAWGGFIEDAHGAGFVSQAQIERYAKQAVTPL